MSHDRSRHLLIRVLYSSYDRFQCCRHYIHMYSSLVTGAKSHKTVTKSQSRILHSYYNNNVSVSIFCAGLGLAWPDSTC